MLDLRAGEHPGRAVLSSLQCADDPGAPGADAEGAASDVRRAGKKRRRQDRLLGHAAGYAVAAAKATATIRARRVFDQFAATHLGGPGALRVSQQDSQ